MIRILASFVFVLLVLGAALEKHNVLASYGAPASTGVTQIESPVAQTCGEDYCANVVSLTCASGAGSTCNGSSATSGPSDLAALPLGTSNWSFAEQMSITEPPHAIDIPPPRA